MDKIKFSEENRKIIITSLITMVGTLAVAAILLWAYSGSIFKYFAGKYVEQSQDEISSGKLAKSGLGSETMLFSQEAIVEGAVKKANPAVVSIVISKEVPKYDTYYNDPYSGPFGNLFNIPGFNLQVPMQRQNGTEKEEIGGGSGFLVSSDGLIVTNRHVVDDKNAEYTVYTSDGKKHEARVIARDQILDVAIIKIEAGAYPYLELGDSDNLQLGQSVIAIGNALAEFRNSISVGVVSGLSRTITAGNSLGSSESLSNVIQTDAAINPGNSGGPLLDLRGKAVGINVAIVEGSENIGFALPINSIKSVIESVKKTGKIVRPYLGLRYIVIDEQLKERNNLEVDYGVLVKNGQNRSDLAVIPGSPADKAGIVENDIVLQIDGQKLDREHDLASLVRGKNVGDTIILKILHKGDEKTVSAKLTAAPQS